jgi:pSer/pThr/pTyr-binding forkhead associated (FHA) protein
MIQLRVLTGKMAGTVWVARHFPVQIGRAAGAHLRLEEDGVFERHLRLDFRPRAGYSLSVLGDALASVNSEPVREATLRNGDVIDVGSARLQFWLADARQSGLRLGEWMSWALVLLVSAGQVALIYWLLR